MLSIEQCRVLDVSRFACLLKKCGTSCSWLHRTVNFLQGCFLYLFLDVMISVIIFHTLIQGSSPKFKPIRPFNHLLPRWLLLFLFVIWLGRMQYYIWVLEVPYTNMLFLWMWWHLLVSLVCLFGTTWFHSELAGALLADCSSINNFLGVCYSYFGSCCKPLHVRFFCITCEVGIFWK